MADRQEIPEWYSGKGKKGDDAECNSLSNECLNMSIDTSKKNDEIKTHPANGLQGEESMPIYLPLIVSVFYLIENQFDLNQSHKHQH